MILGVVAFCKGLRLPNLWSATQAQVDYRFGFVKRGFYGQFLTHAFHLQHYVRFVVASGLILLLLLAALIVFAKTSGLSARVANGVPLAVFFSSFAITYLGNLIGYTDILELLLVLALLLIRNPLWRGLAALAVCCVAMPMHEGFLLLFLPVVLFSFVVDYFARRLSFRAAAAWTGSLSAFSVVLAVLIALHRSLTQEQVYALRNSIASQIDFPIREDFFGVMRFSFRDNLQIMAGKARSIQYWTAHLSAVMELGPVFALLLYYGRLLTRSSNDERVRRYGFRTMIVVACSPLLMHVIGLDVARWDAFACISAFLALALLSRALPTLSVDVSPALSRLAMLVIALNMASGEILLDLPAPKASPFLYEGLRYVFHAHGHIVPPTQ